MRSQPLSLGYAVEVLHARRKNEYQPGTCIQALVSFELIAVCVHYRTISNSLSDYAAYCENMLVL